MAELIPQRDVEEIVARLGKRAREFSGKTILLAGARGFLGRCLTEVFTRLNREVLDKPLSIVALDNLAYVGAQESVFKEDAHVRFVKHDIVQPFDHDPHLDYIVHAAGIPSPFYYRANPLQTMDVSTQGVRHLLNLAKRHHSRFVFFSSSEIYGDPDPAQVPIKESYRGNVACQGSRACYDESKRLGETLCYIFNQTYGVHTNTIRPFNVYGPGMSERDYRVLPNFASRIKAGAPLKVYGTGNQTRTFCYLTDAIVGFILTILFGRPGEPYNIGNPKPEVSMLELVKEIKAVLGRDIAYTVTEHPDTYPADEPQRRAPDMSKARLHLDFTPTVDLPTGLKRFFDWADKVYTGVQ
jgi:UDP-glucuronate decarboxylase